MSTALAITQIVLAVLLTLLIVIQPKGKGLGRSTNSNSFSRRGLEKLIFRLTFVVAFAFIAVSILNIAL